MNNLLSKYLCYYPVTLVKGEFVPFYMAGYKRRQTMKPELLKEWQKFHALKLLDHAKKKTKFYNGRLATMKLDKNNFWRQFSKIPVTEKQDLISSGGIMQATGGLFATSKTTGGSTGEPVKLLKNSNALARERAATWRGYEWAGIGVGDPQGRFWGVPHGKADSLRARIIDFVANRKRVSAFDLTENSLKKYYQDLSNFKPKYLYGYVSVLEAFANYILDKNLRPLPSVCSIITTSEVLTPIARSVIQSAFDVKVFNEYGCGEVGSIAHECRHGSMHLMSDNLIIETLNGEATGELVVTDLFNYAQPMIRYRLGDFATLSDKVCDCGVLLPCIEAIHGRAYDLVITPSGSKIHPEAIMYLFEEMQGNRPIIKQFQVVQRRRDLFIVNIIPTNLWGDASKKLIKDSFRKNIHPDLDISINIVSSLGREKSGKIRVIKNEIDIKV